MLKMEQVQPDVSAPKCHRVAICMHNEDGEVLAEPVEFDISTYRKVTRQSTTIDAICELNTRFFATLTPEEQQKFYAYFVAMKELLLTITQEDLQTRLPQMADLTEDLFLGLKIPQRLIKFVRDIDVPFRSFEGKVLRGHDTKEKTFFEQDYVEVTAISVMCKILSPILGESISLLKPPITDKENKEFFTFKIFEPVLTAPHSEFLRVYDKLKFYLSSTIESTMSGRNNNPNNAHSSMSFTMGDNGYCDKRFIEMICAIVMTKKLVTFDIFKTETVGKTPNIMTYIYVVTFETADSKLSTVQSGTNRMPRFDPTDGAGQEDNTTQLENTARVSKVSFDIPILATVAVEFETPKIIQEYGIDPAAFDKACRYYTKNMIVPSPFNRAIIASLLGRRLGGSAMLLYLRMDAYIKFLVATQFILIQRGFPDLAILLSSTTPQRPRVEPMTSSAARITANYNKTAEYLDCAKLFPGFSEKLTEGRSETGRRITESEFISFETHIARLVRWLVDYDHFINIPPFMWKMLGYDKDDRPMQGDTIALDEGVMKRVCKFLEVTNTPPAPPQAVE